MYRGLVTILFAGMALAQTQVDLRTQSKTIDFTGASFTRPLKTGTALPATCGAGDLFFKTDSPAGANIYGCVGSNTWALETGGGGGGSASLTFALNNTTVGTTEKANYVTGSGVMTALGNDGMQINIQQSADTAVLMSIAAAQSGSDLMCPSTSGSGSNFTCNLTPTLTSYTTGMVLHWRPDVNGAGGATTLNVDTLGAIPVRRIDGATDPTPADIVANQPVLLWYDGGAFRMLAPAINAASSATRPTCSELERGRIWQTLGGAGVKDELAVCAKDEADGFDWRLVY